MHYGTLRACGEKMSRDVPPWKELANKGCCAMMHSLTAGREEPTENSLDATGNSGLQLLLQQCVLNTLISTYYSIACPL